MQIITPRRGTLEKSMKTLEQIQKITEQAEDAQRKAEEKEKRAQIKKEKSDKQRRIQDAKDSALKFYPSEIEKAAKEGFHEYSIDVGEPDAEYTTLHQKYILKYLKKFNPKFENVPREGCSYNYDGDSIDGTEYTYYMTRVTFSW